MSTFAVGDRVFVTDPGLAELRRIMRQYGHDPKPNHHGTVAEIWDDGDLLINFDDGGCAPYPAHETRLLSEASERD